MAIVIVDDDQLVRRQLRRVIEAAGFRVVGEAANGGEALAMVEALKPSVVVMDARMPVMNGLVATQYLAALHPDVKVVAHTSDEALASQMVHLGAMASVQKGSTRQLTRAIAAASGAGA